jgi:deoxyadenosine/deoxycytidine kinase
MAKHKSITLIGNVGSGKSTLTRILARHLPAYELPADLFDVNPFFPLAVADRVRWSLTSDLWFLRRRFLVAKTIPYHLKKYHVVVDSGIPMSFAYAHSRRGSGYYTDDEWQLYKELYSAFFDDFLLPDVVFYLLAPVPFLLERIKKRGRKFELRTYTPEYLRRLTRSLGVVVKQLKEHNVRVIPLDVVKTDFVNHAADLVGIMKELR